MSTPQKTLTQLQSMSAEEIVAAQRAGALDDLLRNGTPEAVAAREDEERVRQASAIRDAEAATDGADGRVIAQYGRVSP